MLFMNKNDCMIVDIVGIAIEKNSKWESKNKNASQCDDTKTK